jgi:hypothetical protein
MAKAVILNNDRGLLNENVDSAARGKQAATPSGVCPEIGVFS